MAWKKNLLALGFGFLLLVVLELLLWLIRFQKPVCEFDPYVSFKESVRVLLEKEYTGEKWLALNPRLRSYFNPIAFPKEKPAGIRRIFVLGESATLGFPFGEQGSYSMFLKLGLDQLDPAYRYQVVNLGAFGFASYRILRVFREVLRYEPDLMVVTMGQNEFLEKREYRQSRSLICLQEKLRWSRVYCLLKVIILRLRPAQEQKFLGVDVNWEKMSTDSETRAKVFSHFAYNLQEMIKLAQAQKTPLLFLTAPSNLKDFPPYRSVHQKGMSPAELAEWAKQFEEAQALRSEKRCREAISLLERLLEKDSGYAEAWYLLGRCLLEEGKFKEAKTALEKALENDAWQVRAPFAINELVLKAQEKGVWVIDLEEIFAEHSEDGIPGEEFFYDHCHPRLEGQALIAKEILKKLNQEHWVLLPEGWELFYDDLVKSYEKALPPAFWVQAYYNLAIELGANMGLKDLGQKYLKLGLEISPEDAKLKRAEQILK